MANIYNILKTNLFNKSPNVKEIMGLCASSPISNLRQVTAKMAEFLNTKQDYYDCLASALSSSPTLMEGSVEMVDDPQYLLSAVSPTKMVSIPVDEALTIISGIIQSMKLLDQDQLSISDVQGNVYVLQVPIEEMDSQWPNVYFNTTSGRIPFIVGNENHEYSINLHAPSLNYVGPYLGKLRDYDVLLNIVERLSIVGDSSTIASCARLLSAYYNISVDIDDIFSHLNAVLFHVSGEYADSISTAIYSLNKILGVTGVVSPSLYLVNAVVESGDLNGCYQELCSAALSANPSDRLNDLYSEFDTRRDSVKFSLRRSKEAYRQGGLRGLINFIIAFFRGGSSITDKDGLMIFTDNKGLLPQEFIAGIVGVIVSTVVQIVGLIVSAFNKVLGFILTILGTIASTIFGYINSSHNDTYANVEANYSDTMTSLGCMPIAFFQREISKVSGLQPNPWFKFFDDLYHVTNSCEYFSVPGGFLFLGPAEISENGEIQRYRTEFHPACNVYDDPSASVPAYLKVQNDTGSDISINGHVYRAGDFGFNIKYLLLHGSGHEISDIYEDLVSNSRVLVNAASGYLTEQDDRSLRSSVQINVALFALWCIERSSSLARALYETWYSNNISNDAILIFSDIDLEQSGNEFEKIVNYGIFDLLGYNSNPSSWNNIVTAAINDPDTISGGLSCRTFNNSAITNLRHLFAFQYGSILTYYYWDFEYCSSGLNESFICSTCCALPDEFSYAIHMPKYNASTFWGWVILSTIVTVAVTTVAVIATVKFKQFAKKKRASNKMKFDAAQQQYNDALAGRYQTVETDPQTGEQHVVEHLIDPNSPQGVALQNSTWNLYKKQARTNNLWQKLIGGSRYDVSTFWGEAEDDDQQNLSFKEKLSSLVDSDTVRSSDSNPVAAVYDYLHASQDVNRQLLDALQGSSDNMTTLIEILRDLELSNLDKLTEVKRLIAGV